VFSLVVAGWFVPAAAAAAPPTAAGSDPPSIRVPYRDLDLHTPQGVATLYGRVRQAALEVCDARQPLVGTRLISAAAAACVRRSMASIVQQLAVPGLAALHAEQQALLDALVAKPACDVSQRSRIII
jgi:UrcA family protein